MVHNCSFDWYGYCFISVLYILRKPTICIANTSVFSDFYSSWYFAVEYFKYTQVLVYWYFFIAFCILWRAQKTWSNSRLFHEPMLCPTASALSGLKLVWWVGSGSLVWLHFYWVTQDKTDCMLVELLRAQSASPWVFWAWHCERLVPWSHGGLFLSC